MDNARVAVITGAGRLKGVGAATARLLAQRQINLVLNCLHESDEIHQIAQECRAFGIETEIYVADLTQEAHCIELAHFTQKKFNRVDSLINCIGYSQPIAFDRIDLVETALFEKVFQINTLAPFMLAKAFHSALKASDDGVLINISSTAGLTGKSSSIPYSVAKGALNTLTLSLAQALSPHVRVNAVCPSFIDSSWWRDTFPDKEKYEALKASAAARNLLHKALTPENVAIAILSIMDNSAMTGELIRLDAGAHIGIGNTK